HLAVPPRYALARNRPSCPLRGPNLPYRKHPRLFCGRTVPHRTRLHRHAATRGLRAAEASLPIVRTGFRRHRFHETRKGGADPCLPAYENVDMRLVTWINPPAAAGDFRDRGGDERAAAGVSVLRRDAPLPRPG